MWKDNRKIEMKSVCESWEWVWRKGIDYQKWVIKMLFFYLNEKTLFWGMHLSKKEMNYKSVLFEWFWVHLQKITFGEKIDKPT